MRKPVDAERVRALARALGQIAPPGSRMYLTGGATAVIEGWRESTIDIDLRLEPETDELLRRLVEAKEELHLNVELASPPDFVPELPGWRERSPSLFSEGNLTVHHFDLYSQALSKIERGFELDLRDVESMVEHGLIDPRRARELFESVEPQLHRYPAIDPRSLREAIGRALQDAD